MISNFQIRKNSTLPWLEATITNSGLVPIAVQAPSYSCSNPINPDSVDLTNCTVAFEMWKCGRELLPVGLIGVASIIDAVRGKVRYKWGVGDTSVTGLFYGTFIITLPDLTVLRWPSQKEALSIEVLE